MNSQRLNLHIQNGVSLENREDSKDEHSQLIENENEMSENDLLLILERRKSIMTSATVHGGTYR